MIRKYSIRCAISSGCFISNSEDGIRSVPQALLVRVVVVVKLAHGGESNSFMKLLILGICKHLHSRSIGESHSEPIAGTYTGAHAVHE